MIKISAHLSKKVPAEVSYSSRQVGASLEIEVSDSDKPEQIKVRLRELYSVLQQSVEEQITGGLAPAAATAPAPAATNRITQPAAETAAGTKRGTAGNGGNTAATQAQQKAIFAISKSLGIAMTEALAGHNVADPKELTIKQASAVIDQLKARQNTR